MQQLLFLLGLNKYGDKTMHEIIILLPSHFYYSVVIIHFSVTNSHKYQVQHEPFSEHVIFFDHTSQLEMS